MNVETAGHPLAIVHDKCPVLKERKLPQAKPRSVEGRKR